MADATAGISSEAGGCLCGSVRYLARAAPLRVTICHCRFCQRSTGSAYLVEPIFETGKFSVTEGTPATYAHRSEGSGKQVTIHFCRTCGTKLFLGFERFPDVFGVYGGTFDDPNWFARPSGNSRHIFLESAQHGTMIPAGVNTFERHAILADGTPATPTVYDAPHAVGPRSER